MTTALQQPSLSSQCMAEFLGTALLIFFGTGCVAALKVAGASFGLWEISIIWGLASAWRSTSPPAFPVRTSTLP